MAEQNQPDDFNRLCPLAGCDKKIAVRSDGKPAFGMSHDGVMVWFCSQEHALEAAKIAEDNEKRDSDRNKKKIDLKPQDEEPPPHSPQRGGRPDAPFQWTSREFDAINKFRQAPPKPPPAPPVQSKQPTSPEKPPAAPPDFSLPPSGAPPKSQPVPPPAPPSPPKGARGGAGQSKGGVQRVQIVAPIPLPVTITGGLPGGTTPPPSPPGDGGPDKEPKTPREPKGPAPSRMPSLGGMFRGRGGYGGGGMVGNAFSRAIINLINQWRSIQQQNQTRRTPKQKPRAASFAPNPPPTPPRIPSVLPDTRPRPPVLQKEGFLSPSHSMKDRAGLILAEPRTARRTRPRVKLPKGFNPKPRQHSAFELPAPVPKAKPEATMSLFDLPSDKFKPPVTSKTVSEVPQSPSWRAFEELAEKIEKLTNVMEESNRAQEKTNRGQGQQIQPSVIRPQPSFVGSAQNPSSTPRRQRGAIDINQWRSILGGGV